MQLFYAFCRQQGAAIATAYSYDPLLQWVRDPCRTKWSKEYAAKLQVFQWNGCKVKPEDLTENSVLIGSSQSIIDTLKKVEATGIEEVILYFNVGQKPHEQVKDEMARFMEEVAPEFEGSHLKRRAT